MSDNTPNEVSNDDLAKQVEELTKIVQELDRQLTRAKQLVGVVSDAYIKSL
jgi:hypothetical protein